MLLGWEKTAHSYRCMSDSDKGPWETTAVQNLVRYRSSGTYFARFRVGGKLVWKSLETPVFSVAKQRLPDVIRSHRSKGESIKAHSTGRMTVRDAAQFYLAKVDANVSLKPRSKDYRHMMLDFIQRSWPALFDTDIRKVHERDCEEWLAKYQLHYSPTVKTGARFNNPAAQLSRVRVRPKRLELPSREQFLKFVDAIQSAGARQSKDCANLVCFLAYTGMRIGEVRFVTWNDVNFARKQLHIKGDPETGTKNSETRFVPMISELEGMLRTLRDSRSDEPATATVMRVFECEKSMTHAALKMGMSRITHHDLRHLFATICIESGVDVPTVSRWLGHKDGGALCMKTYGHLRQEHSLAQAQRVTFRVTT
jgi:integrase